MRAMGCSSLSVQEILEGQSPEVVSVRDFSKAILVIYNSWGKGLAIRKTCPRVKNVKNDSSYLRTRLLGPCAVLRCFGFFQTFKGSGSTLYQILSLSLIQSCWTALNSILSLSKMTSSPSRL